MTDRDRQPTIDSGASGPLRSEAIKANSQTDDILPSGDQASAPSSREQEICDQVMRQMALRKGSSTKRDFEVVSLVLSVVCTCRHDSGASSACSIHPQVEASAPSLEERKDVCASRPASAQQLRR